MYQANLTKIGMTMNVMVTGFTGRDVAQPSIQRQGAKPKWSAIDAFKHEREGREADARLTGSKRRAATRRLPTLSRPSLACLPTFSRGG
jgi:hypothetical protein